MLDVIKTCVLVSCIISLVDGVFIWKKTMNVKETIELEHEMLKGAKVFNASDQKYLDTVKRLKNYTLDEKCELGYEFGIGFQTTSPYVYPGGGSKKNAKRFTGVMPHTLLEIMKYCCPKSKITYGHHFKSVKDIETHYSEESELDISFPLYGMKGKDSVEFKDFPFIPTITAPKVVLLVPDELFKELNSRTQVLLTTIFNTWPMLVFIVVSAMLSGLTVWLLDKKENSDEFPPTFFSGAWEGVWWAFVTMTTVGYGDRSPKSPYARAFCIMWILLGIVLISLFTGLITAALSVSATPVFNFAGARIGAVRGSLEYQLAVGLNAEVIGYEHHASMLTNLTSGTNFLHGALLDNFVLSSNTYILKRSKLRIEREFDHPVTYGYVLKRNSTKVEECFRRFTRRNPEEMFEIIAKQIKPIKNPTDAKRLEVVAAEDLDFYQEAVFKNVVYVETGLLIFSLIAGVIWEFFVRNKDSAAYRMVGRMRGKPAFVKDQEYSLTDNHDTKLLNNGFPDNTIATTNHNNNNELDSLIEEYNDFHARWIERVKQLTNNKERTDEHVPIMN